MALKRRTYVKEVKNCRLSIRHFRHVKKHAKAKNGCNDTSIDLIDILDILDKIALAKDQGLLNEEALSIYLRFRKITQ
jgi:hypothetical protein